VLSEEFFLTGVICRFFFFSVDETSADSVAHGTGRLMGHPLALGPEHRTRETDMGTLLL